MPWNTEPTGAIATHNENKFLIRPVYELEYTIWHTHLVLLAHFSKKYWRIPTKNHAYIILITKNIDTVKNLYCIFRMNETENVENFFYFAFASIEVYANECDKNAQHVTTCMWQVQQNEQMIIFGRWNDKVSMFQHLITSNQHWLPPLLFIVRWYLKRLAQHQ